MQLMSYDTVPIQHQQGKHQALLKNRAVSSYTCLFKGNLGVSETLVLMALSLSVKSLPPEFETGEQLALFLAGQEVT